MSKRKYSSMWILRRRLAAVAQRMQTGVGIMTAETDERLNVRITNLQNESEVAKVLYVAPPAHGRFDTSGTPILCAS